MSHTVLFQCGLGPNIFRACKETTFSVGSTTFLLLTLDMVDNSTSPLRTYFGQVFSPFDCPGRVIHPTDPGACASFHLHHATSCHFMGHLLTSFTLKW